MTVVITGSTIGSREGVAIDIAQRAERPLVRIDLDRCRQYIEQPYDLIRELRLSGALPYLINISDQQEDPQLRIQVQQLGAALAKLPYPVLVGGTDRRSVAGLLGGERPSLTVQVQRSTLDERIEAWTDAMTRRGWSTANGQDVAERFYSVGGTTIHQVLERASAECGGQEPDLDAMWAAARECSRPEFQGLAEHIVPRYGWDDLICPTRSTNSSTRTTSPSRRPSSTVGDAQRSGSRLRDQGSAERRPGTGKTMAAEVIAGTLGLDLFRVDLSSVISRWVGETEKNLKEVFDAAEGGTAVLLFDEADSLFGSRGEVKQAQDRFANQEVGFLLQRLEVFEGCAILTTNLQENIDEAFLRRFGAVIEFPMPSVEQRTQLWQRAIPKGAPLDDDIDLPAVAKQFVIAGGSIINSAINACILASTLREPVGMKHIVTAVAQEYVKMGKQVTAVHFGEWHEFVKTL